MGSLLCQVPVEHESESYDALSSDLSTIRRNNNGFTVPNAIRRRLNRGLDIAGHAGKVSSQADTLTPGSATIAASA